MTVGEWIALGFFRGVALVFLAHGLGLHAESVRWWCFIAGSIVVLATIDVSSARKRTVADEGES